MKNINFDKLAGGSLKDQFAKAFDQVIENMADVNTPYKNARQITIKLKFVQNEKRDDVVMTATIDTKLASQAPTGTNFAVGRDLKTGDMYVEEYGKNLADQYSLDDIKVDEETGEVAEKNNELIVFPRAAQA